MVKRDAAVAAGETTAATNDSTTAPTAKVGKDTTKNLLTDDNLEATMQTSAHIDAIGTQEMTASYGKDRRTKLAVEVASRLKNKARLY